jgi:hypothetical protein
LPENGAAAEPMSVIFQTAEDGIGDTVKPRLVQSGADCGRVIVIDESEKELSLSDLRIEQAITLTGARLFILDPLQAYLGADVDMHRANQIRPILKRIGTVAEKTGCAVVVVGHLNKGANKSQYRGLGSIDIQAAARSVLTVGRIGGKPYTRAIAQGKNNLAPEDASIGFELDPQAGFRWISALPVTIVPSFYLVEILLVEAPSGVDPPRYLIDVHADFLHFGGDGFQVRIVRGDNVAVDGYFPHVCREVVCVKQAHFSKIKSRLASVTRNFICMSRFKPPASATSGSLLS